MSEEITISEIKVIPIKANEGLVGFASCVINGSIFIGSIAIHLTRNQDFRLVFPAKKLESGKCMEHVHPISKEAYEIIRKPIVDEYLRLLTSDLKG